MRKPKNPLLQSLSLTPPEEIIEKGSKNVWNRRQFLSTSLKATAVMGVSALLPEFLFARAVAPKVAIIGGGIAGLNAAWYLKKAGISATIYEGDKKVGGRIQTIRNYFADGLTTEAGGEFIDSGHTEMLRLTQEFGLQLKDRSTDPLNKGEGKESYFIEGRRYTLNEALSEFRHYTAQIKKDALSLGESYRTPSAIRLDHLSIEEYFDRIGLQGWLRKLLDVAYTSEFGMKTGEQSSLNFLSMISTESKNGFDIYGESDERFGIVGGNASIIEKLQQKLTSQIQTNYKLSAITAKGKGFRLSFENGREIYTDLVLITIPFTMLREVELKIENFPAWKRKAIAELGYGNSSKLILGVQSRPWRENLQAAGYCFNEKLFNGWDSTHMQNQNKGPGSFTIYTGADAALDVASKFQHQQALATEYLPFLNQVFPGSKEAFTGKTFVADWPNRPFIKADYAAYKVGQWTTLAGNEIKPVGNLFFAGEHCSPEFQGFMNGGAETGKLAAQAILKKLKSKSIPNHLTQKPQQNE